ncbi:MAG: iron uptake system protein EfeO [Propionibacteriaceae bacterium]|nr:iron uptake system protein EfeO [Propionibacteriaceae bacterium]
MTRVLTGVALVTVATMMAVAAGCTDRATAQASDSQRISVQATDNDCIVSAGDAPAGRLSFTITNRGTQVTEFMLMGPHGIGILGTVEDLAPGLTRELVLTVPSGQYLAACRPGMTGDGIRQQFKVHGSTELEGTDDRELINQAVDSYEAYVRHQAQELLADTELFVTAYTAGEDDRARQLYPETRIHWERIETVTHSFRDLNAHLDSREADLASNQQWTGWHRIEKDLWPQRADGYVPLSPAQRIEYADALMEATRAVEERTRTTRFTLHEIGHGARTLLDEVATRKVTGEEEYWSRTDLWDFQGNLDGARVAWAGLRPFLQQRDPALDRQLASGFDDVQILLNRHRVGSGFKGYDELSHEEIRELADAVNRLSEPLAQLAAAVA